MHYVAYIIYLQDTFELKHKRDSVTSIYGPWKPYQKLWKILKNKSLNLANISWRPVCETFLVHKTVVWLLSDEKRNGYK